MFLEVGDKRSVLANPVTAYTLWPACCPKQVHDQHSLITTQLSHVRESGAKPVHCVFGDVYFHRLGHRDQRRMYSGQYNTITTTSNTIRIRDCPRPNL